MKIGARSIAQVIPIDGKTLRGSYDREAKQGALSVVSAWASEHRLVLGQLKVNSKSNEITVIPQLLEMLHISGSIITIDDGLSERDCRLNSPTPGGDYMCWHLRQIKASVCSSRAILCKPRSRIL